MAEVTPITTHVDDALARKIEQYKDTPKFDGLVTSLVEQIQLIEDAAHPLFLKRMLAEAEGAQLDGFGKIVGLARQGFDDDFYRILLNVKIGQNISSGEPERVIAVMKILVQANLVHYQNHGDGEISLSVDAEIAEDFVDFIYSNMQKMIMAGVRITYISTFDPDESFSMDGTGPIGLGFSSLADPSSGGKLAYIHRLKFPFAMEGDDRNADGFGALGDPFAGGVFVGL